MNSMLRALFVFGLLSIFSQSLLAAGGPPISVKTPPKPNGKNVLLVSMGHGNALRPKMLKSAAETSGLGFAIQGSRGLQQNHWAQLAEQWDLILLDGMDAANSQKVFGDKAPLFKKLGTQVVAVREAESAVAQLGVSEAQAKTLIDYYTNGGQQNFNNLMAYAAGELFNLHSKTVAAPQLLPKTGFYHPEFPGKVGDDRDAMRKWLSAGESQPMVALGMHRSVIELEDTQVVDQLLAQLEQLGAKAVGFYYEGVDERKHYTDLLQTDGETWVDLIINYRVIHYIDKRLQEFSQLNVPVIHALNYFGGDKQKFLDDHAGVSGTMTPFFLVMPESSGVIDPVILAANGEAGHKAAIEEQLQALAERAVNHARLKHIPKPEKKLALMMWNYPPGEKNIGAAFLNVPVSLERIVSALDKDGYQVEPKPEDWFIDNAGKLLRPMYRAEDASPLVEEGLADYLPLRTYQQWFETLPQEVRTPIVERWGEPSENPMLVDYKGERAFVIPRMRSGNMIMLPQPGRGDGKEDSASLYHSTITPINHFYLAAYLYTREVWGADAILHLGTHGSQEWLPGKERGLWAYDSSNLAVGNLPVIYPYIIDNVGEAMQAKRRGRATMISHMTPGFAEAGAYRELAELQVLLADYTQLDEGGVKNSTRDKAIELAEAHKMLSDLGLTREQVLADFDNMVPQLQDYIQSLASQSQPLGLHSFGDVPVDSHLYTTISQMLGDDFKALANVLEQKRGWAIADDQKVDNNGAVKLEALPGYQLLQRYLQNADVNLGDDALQADLDKAKEYYDNFHGTQEMPNLLRALNGEFIEPGNGNDPIRNPQAAPTGKNLIGFDPARVPTKAAYEVGSKLAEDQIADYYQRHGEYPDKLAFSLWSLETMRHHGVLEAQILRTLGLRPKWNAAGQVTGAEIIPFGELKRPRVDVAITVTGLYRDAFPNVMLWIADAIDQIANLKEESNSIYVNTQAIKASLKEKGMSAEDIDYLSSIRIFSNETGNYGTGLADSSLASDTWETDDKLADLYINRMGYGFGKDAKRWSEKIEGSDLYRQVLSGTDGVVFSRSSNLYALLTNDDPFQYFGGIGLAVRNIDGATPEMFVSNLRKAGSEKTETMERFLAKEMRSRYFHPRWIEQMQNEGYAGATAILDRMNNFWGWEVMAPEYVKDEQWQQFFEIYVEDSYDMNINEWFEQANPTAQAQILERMLEAVRKDYWEADAETIKKMTERYIELANKYDVYTDNETFKEYVDGQAAGFGLDIALPVNDMAAPDVQANPAQAPINQESQQVEGQQLEKVEHTEPTEQEWDMPLLFALSLSLLFFIAGVLMQMRPTRYRVA
ncbi:cobaltochelatase subunit CobN [Maricurvus nonylphenolicus]|uniref:cobaltochelatase subunit CobN n=1 Tax=Maricurvus nonylphenolicus TaxID=1008307 RepID=UPI0036F3B02A